MSTHKCPVVPIKLEKHPNADSLSIVRVNSFVYCARTSEWENVPLGVWIEPDFMCSSDRPEFNFLAATHKVIENNGVKGYRIKVKRLRGVMSMGLMIPAPEGAKEGDDMREHFGIVRYEPPMPLSTFGEACKPPPGVRYVYDVESAYNFVHLFEENEEVVATEKVHGANARFAYVPEVGMFAGSRSEWKRNDPNILWWKALANHPEIEEFCKNHPEVTVYGEVYGQVQDLKYNFQKGVGIVVFDLLRHGVWIDHDEAREIGKNLPWVPVIYRGPWNKEKLFMVAETGDSEVAKWKEGKPQIKEGLVIKPVKERNNLEIGRTQLKIVSNAYLERA
jgi:RNA ligase (TIGR02306 family)